MATCKRSTGTKRRPLRITIYARPENYYDRPDDQPEPHTHHDHDGRDTGKESKDDRERCDKTEATTDTSRELEAEVDKILTEMEYSISVSEGRIPDCSVAGYANAMATKSITSAASSAASGAIIGSRCAGGRGAAIGAAIGAATGGISGYVTGAIDHNQRCRQYTHESYTYSE